MDRALFLNIVVVQCPTIFQLFSCKNQSLLVRRNPFLVLYLCLYIRYRITTLYINRNRLSSECLYKNLHLTILWRQKEAFSDGVSSVGRSWGDITKQYAHELVHPSRGMTPDDAEKELYKSIFIECYGKHATSILPYYWMPKWVSDKITDPSARVLQCYENPSAPSPVPYHTLLTRISGVSQSW